jgi:phage N-6-adenine-methyltransferase
MQQNLFNVEQDELTSDDYYTPQWLFDQMGIEFDLDVASPPHNTCVPCKRYYTRKDDGLTQPWYGNVWMNPPFSKPRPWVDKFMQHANGVALLPVSKSQWFYDVWQSQAAITYINYNFRFIDPKGSNGSIFMPIVLIAYGKQNIEAIRTVGKIR